MKVITANYSYGDFLNKIRKTSCGKGLFFVFDYFRGKRKFVGWALHHLNGRSNGHQIQNRKTSKQYEQMLEKINKGQKTIIKELESCILIPVWFHDYLHETGLANLIQDKQELFDKLKQILNTEDTIQEIKKLKFDGKTIIDQLKSIQRLVNVSHLVSSVKVTQMLQKAYREVVNQMLNYFKKNKK